ncbi:MAG: phosphate ABC transporter permease PstA [Schlesneria sp.]
MKLGDDIYERRLIWRHRIGLCFEWLCRLATMGALAMLVVLMGSIFSSALSPGRGSGLAPVSLTETGKNPDVDGDLTYSVSKVVGGDFYYTSDPEEKIKSFSSSEVRGGQVVFNHNGKRAAPVFDLTVSKLSAGKEPIGKFKEVGPGQIPSECPVPDVHPPKPAKPWGWLTWNFLTHGNSDDPLQAGIMAGFWGSVWLIGLTALIVVPVGVGAALYLEEYAKPNALTRFIQLNIANLAGVPSIVYGILGFTVFSRMFGVFDKQITVVSINFLRFFGARPIDIIMPLGPVVLSGAFTLALLSLPVVIITSQEALRSIPASLRHAAYALGATKWQTIWHQVLPASLPGILTGVILSLSRAIGEAAPIAVIGVAAHLSFAPGRITGISDLVQNPDKLIRAPFDRFTALPTLVYSWVNEAAPNFEHVAAAGIIVLLATLLSMNGAAILIRQRFQQWNRW